MHKISCLISQWNIYPTWNKAVFVSSSEDGGVHSVTVIFVGNGIGDAFKSEFICTSLDTNPLAGKAIIPTFSIQLWVNKTEDVFIAKITQPALKGKLNSNQQSSA